MKIFLAILLILSIGLFVLNAENDIFVEQERVKINIDKILYSGITDIEQIPDGFVLLLARSRKSNLIVKIDRKGNLVSMHDKVGNGPGELRNVYNIAITDSAVYAIELQSPFIHEFSHDLQFRDDYRIKRGGQLIILGNMFAGVWAPYYSGDKNMELVETLALYDLKSFKFIRTAFSVKEVPALFHLLGGICRIDNDSFAGVYPSEYQVKIFDRNIQFKKNLIETVPGHIKKYHPYKKSPHVVDQDIIDWANSWAVIQTLFYIDGKFIIKYLYNRDSFLDIIDGKGKILYAGYKEKKKFHIVFVEDQKYVWRLKVEEFENIDRYTLVKQKLVLEVNENEKAK